MVKTWAFSNKATPQDWAQLISTVLKSGQHLLWKCIFEEKRRILEQQEKGNGLNISLDQILGNIVYFDPQNHTLFL